jgi:hypothetical protein
MVLSYCTALCSVVVGVNTRVLLVAAEFFGDATILMWSCSVHLLLCLVTITVVSIGKLLVDIQRLHVSLGPGHVQCPQPFDDYASVAYQ